MSSSSLLARPDHVITVTVEGVGIEVVVVVNMKVILDMMEVIVDTGGVYMVEEVDTEAVDTVEEVDM